MVNFHSSVTFVREFAAAVNLWHTVDGIFIWEFFTTLGYEWDVIRGHRPYRWTIWVYSITRISTLTAIVLNLIGFDDKSNINCQAWATLNVFFAYVAFGSASLLIVLRIIAIWNKDAIIVITAMGLWLANVAFLLYGTVIIRSVWSDEIRSCILLNAQSNKLNVIVSLVSDTTLLLIMLVGLLRLQTSEFGLGRILWNQSLVWLVLATVAEVPPTVFMFLNLNEALDLADVSGSQYGHNVNCRDKDASFSYKPWHSRSVRRGPRGNWHSINDTVPRYGHPYKPARGNKAHKVSLDLDFDLESSLGKIKGIF